MSSFRMRSNSNAPPVGTASLPSGGRVPAWLAFSPALLAITLTTWLLAWHHSLVLILGFSARDFRDHLLVLAGLYLLVSLGFSIATHAALCRYADNRRRTRMVIAIASLVFLLSAVMRVLDWGTFYYSAGHVDEDFWASAFYRQNLGFASAWAAWLPVIAFILVACVFAQLLRLARRFALARAANSLGAARRRPTRVFWLNALVSVAIVGGAHTVWAVLLPAPTRGISDNVRLAFAGLPELKVLEPLVVRALQPPVTAPELDPVFLSKLERAGLRLRSVDANYPLLKNSIYIDPSSSQAPKPVLAPGTNVIIVLAESLSADLLDERVHGVKGLTPHFADFARHAYTFRNLYCADFPTIKGQIASLASFAFDHRGLPSSHDTHGPLESNYLFLSDVLKQRAGYTTVHVQSDFGRFANTSTIFKAHHYDWIRSADDADLLEHAQLPLTKTWGIQDRDLFAAVNHMLERREVHAPFLMTIATTDMHFPFTSVLHHPGTNGSDLLDAVYTEDHAFGVFWDYFKGSEWASNTAVLVTADHALIRRAIRRGGADPKPSEFDYIAGMLYVPEPNAWAGHSSDVTCSQLDLAPTLLDLLGIDTQNPYLGLSIFSERPRYPLVLGRDIPLGRLSARDRAAVAAIHWTDEDQVRYQALLRYLAAADRVLPRNPRQP